MLKHETKKCGCGQLIHIEYAFCREAGCGVPVRFYDGNELYGWGMAIKRCPECGAELMYEELEVV